MAGGDARRTAENSEKEQFVAPASCRLLFCCLLRLQELHNALMDAHGIFGEEIVARVGDH
jgi:hypothetical protein